MRIENRELYASFWDSESQSGVYALLIGWNNELQPVVAYAFGLRKLEDRFEITTSVVNARRNASMMKGPR